MTQRGHSRHCAIVISILKHHVIRLKLIVKPWLGQRLGASQASIKHIPQVLDRGGDDSGAPSTTDYEVQAVVGQMLDYCGGDG